MLGFYLLSLFGIIISITASALILLYVYQEKLIFINGKKIESDYTYQFTNNFEELFVSTDAKNSINALHFKLKRPKGVVLYCHGNKGNLKKWGERVSYFLEYNIEVLVFDYRNYGKSTGKFNEKAMYQDALKVYDYLKKKYDEDNIIVYGFSLGCTFATKIAANNKPKELVLEAPFYNLKIAVKYKNSYLPTWLLKYKFETEKELKKVESPITVFHGNKDKVTFIEDSKKLLATNKNDSNRYIEIKEATHHNCSTFNRYQKNLKEVIDR